MFNSFVPSDNQRIEYCIILVNYNTQNEQVQSMSPKVLKSSKYLWERSSTSDTTGTTRL